MQLYVLSIILKLAVTVMVTVVISLTPVNVSAQPACNEITVGSCISGKRCVKETVYHSPNDTSFSYTLTGSCGSSELIGPVKAPDGVLNVSMAQPGLGAGFGIIWLLSNFIRLAAIVAGVWVMFNAVAAGWTYITSNGDSNAHGKIVEKMTFSIIGLLIIAVAYTIAALFGLLMFGDASYILTPVPATIYNPTP